MTTTTTSLTNGTLSRNGHAAAPPLTPVVTAPKGRDAKGHFTEGNKAACGNPVNRKMAAFRRVGLEAITEDDIRQLFRRWLELALAGDIAAGGLLAKYVLGKPRELDPDDVNNHEWTLVARWPSRAEFESACIDLVRPEEAVELLRLIRNEKPNLHDEDRANPRDLLDERAARRRRRR
jgi:hypothetical protein